MAAVVDETSRALGIVTIFTRPQGLDRIWVRFGFIPTPEMALPEELSGRPGAGLYACKASVDLFGLEKNDFIPQVQDIITVGEFYEIAAGGQIIFT